MSAWLWLLVPFAPLLGAALPWLRERAPAMAVAERPAGAAGRAATAVALELPWLWEGALGRGRCPDARLAGLFRRALDLRGVFASSSLGNGRAIALLDVLAAGRGRQSC